VWAAELSRNLRSDDVVLAYDFIASASLTFTRPIPNQIVLLPNLETSDLHSVNRLVFLESVFVVPQRSKLAARAYSLGFKTMEERPVHAADGKTVLPEWHILVFTRQ